MGRWASSSALHIVKSSLVIGLGVLHAVHGSMESGLELENLLLLLELVLSLLVLLESGLLLRNSHILAVLGSGRFAGVSRLAGSGRKL